MGREGQDGEHTDAAILDGRAQWAFLGKWHLRRDLNEVGVSYLGEWESTYRIAFLLPPFACLHSYTEGGNYFLKKHSYLLCQMWEATEGMRGGGHFDWVLIVPEYLYFHIFHESVWQPSGPMW